MTKFMMNNIGYQCGSSTMKGSFLGLQSSGCIKVERPVFKVGITSTFSRVDDHLVRLGVPSSLNKFSSDHSISMEVIKNIPFRSRKLNKIVPIFHFICIC